MRRLAEDAASGSALVLELGPLGRDELTALLAVRAQRYPLPRAVVDGIIARSEGNPFFAEELRAAAGDGGGELPRGLRDLLLQRVTRLGHPAQALLRLAAAAEHEVRYPLLRKMWSWRRRSYATHSAGRWITGILVAERNGRLPLPACAPRGGGLRDDPPGGARRAARAACRRARPQRAGGRGGTRAALGGGGPPGRGTRRLRRSGQAGGGGLRPRGGSHIWKGRSRCGPRCRTRPGWHPGLTSPGSAPGPPGSPATSAPPHARSSSHGAQSSSPERENRTVRHSFRWTSVNTFTRLEVTPPRSPRSSAQWSWCHLSRPLRSVRTRWGHSQAR